MVLLVFFKFISFSSKGPVSLTASRQFFELSPKIFVKIPMGIVSSSHECLINYITRLRLSALRSW